MANLARIIDRLYAAVPAEVDDVELPCLEGALPPELDGVLYRNGPGRLHRGGQVYGHPFDGDGMVSQIVLDGPKNRVVFRNRFVRTREFVDEERADKILYRGFGTNVPGGLATNALRMRFKNAANTNVVAHGGRLLALWEGGWPHELDPHTLATRSRFNFDGALDNRFGFFDEMVNPELPFSAHPRVDPVTGDMFNFGTAFGVQNRLLLYQVDRTGRMVWQSAVDLDELTFVHDFLITDRWLVFFLPRVSFDVPRALLGATSPVGSIRIDDDASMRILLVPRPRRARSQYEVPRWLDVDRGGFVFHHAWVADRGSELETLGMWLPTFPQFRGGWDEVFSERGMPEAIARPVRFRLNLKTGRARSEVIDEAGAELPSLSHDDATMFATAAPAGRVQPYFSAWMRADTAGQHPAMVRDQFPKLVGEPVAVGKTEGGHVAALAYDPTEDRTELCLLDPVSLATTARWALPDVQPPGLHGSWLGRERAEQLGTYG